LAVPMHEEAARDAVTARAAHEPDHRVGPDPRLIESCGGAVLSR
jgi:hypothetical protein